MKFTKALIFTLVILAASLAPKANDVYAEDDMKVKIECLTPDKEYIHTSVISEGESVDGITYDAKTHTLKMENVNYDCFTLSIESDTTKPVYPDFYIDIKGDNKVTFRHYSVIIAGVGVNIHFIGDGTLSASLYNKEKYDDGTAGCILDMGNITLDGPTLNIEDCFFMGMLADAIYGYEETESDYGSIEIKSGAINIFMPPYKHKYYNSSTELVREYYSFALHASNKLIISGGLVNVTYVEPEWDYVDVTLHGIPDDKDEDRDVATIGYGENGVAITGGVLVVNLTDELKELVAKRGGKDIYVMSYNSDTNECKPGDVSKALVLEGVDPSKGIDIKKAKLTLEKNVYDYTGKAIMPKVVGSLVVGKDYTISYANNVNAGTATATITGKGIFKGTQILNFTIKGKIVAAGQKVKDKKYIYKVTKAASADGKTPGQVSVVGLRKKSLTTLKIAANVTIGGFTYKVTSIGKKAFAKKTKVTKVYIGKNVKTIGAGAFAGCKKLKTVVIKSVKLKKIGKGAFKKMAKGAVIKLPKSKKLKKTYKKLIKNSKSGKLKVK